MEAIQGVIETISRPYNGGWRIAKVRLHGSAKTNEQLTVVGDLPLEINIGDTCLFSGTYSTHPKYGKQFKATDAVIEIPKDEAGIREYLDRSFVWIGPVLAGRLVETFGDRLFDVMENSPAELASIQGITPERAEEIGLEYLKIKIDREDDLWFARNHITPGMRNRLVTTYGNKKDAIQRVMENPYVLSDEIWGVGFKKSDQIALSIGIAHDSAIRVGACLRWLLKEANSEGHCYLPQDELIAKCIEFISCDYGQVFSAISDSLNSGKVIQTGEFVYNAPIYQAEIEIAEKLCALAGAPHAQIMSELTADEIAELDEDQQAALALALESKILIITGGPGVGKTHTTNTIIRALGKRSVELACPTGKAAKRMSEMTGRETRTIHRLLEYSPISGGFTRNQDNPLDCDTIIIDETSMIDVSLMHSLMDALTLDTQVIFVGDHNQLPSVGPGRILADMIESGVISVAYLKTLHRQAALSRINVNAQKIQTGEKLKITDFSGPADSKGDFWFVPEDSADAIPSLITKIIQAIPGQFGFGFDAIQVLCPQRRGPIGTQAMNEVLRPVLNPDGQKLTGTSFQSGDRVIQTRNNYDLGIFNGDIGTVSSADRDYLYLNFEDLRGAREVAYPLSDIGDLQLAYALTVHKFQGSENPVIIIPVHTTNYLMLQRNLLYTGITRGKKLVVLVGTMKAINLAIRTVDSSQRYSNLQNWLQGGAK